MTCYLDRYQKIVSICRSEAPKATLFVGGSAFSLFPEEFVKKLDVDYGVVGEGENVFVAMVDEIDQHGSVIGDYADENGVVFPGKVKSLDAGVEPARDLLDISAYFSQGGSINIQTKRGCVYKCIYCTYPVLEGNTVRGGRVGLLLLAGTSTPSLSANTICDNEQNLKAFADAELPVFDDSNEICEDVSAE